MRMARSDNGTIRGLRFFVMFPGAESNHSKCWAFRAILEKVTVKVIEIDPTAGKFTAIQPFNQTLEPLYPKGD